MNSPRLPFRVTSGEPHLGHIPLAVFSSVLRISSTWLLDAFIEEIFASRIIETIRPHRSLPITRSLCFLISSGSSTKYTTGVSPFSVFSLPKPENVIIRGSEAILIDFDASRIFKSDTNQDTQILGTTGYAAPEQYGIAQTDERADIYSLGVLLNIMLTGKHPSKELASGRLGRIVQKCTMVNPEKRYKSVLYLMEAL